MNVSKADIVVLKSGGPPMTVVGVEGDSIECEWFVDHDGPWQGPFSATFDLCTLKAPAGSRETKSS